MRFNKLASRNHQAVFLENPAAKNSVGKSSLYQKICAAAAHIFGVEMTMLACTRSPCALACYVRSRQIVN
jgi:hypothetical protein